jgi:Ni/Fe-hydrogenase 1 B-type cytochrome subunit
MGKIKCICQPVPPPPKPVLEYNNAYIADHWVRVVAMAVLIFTGFFIHWPFIAGGPNSTIMASMRFFHFVAGYTFIIGLVIRVYMAFNSRFDADWRDFGIMRNLVNVPDILCWYLFLKKEHKKYRRYNPLQAYAYLGVAFLVVLAAVTGFAIYHGKLFLLIDSQAAFGWVNHLLGSESYTRLAHIFIMWCFIVFMIIHVYLSWMNSAVKRDNSFTSIFTGYKLDVHHGSE